MVERVNGRLKDDFGAHHLRVRGHKKVYAYLTLVGTCGAKMKVQPVVNVHYLFWERAKSRQFCGGISLQIGCVTGLQALPIGPDMDVYMAGDCCGLI